MRRCFTAAACIVMLLGYLPAGYAQQSSFQEKESRNAQQRGQDTTQDRQKRNRQQPGQQPGADRQGQQGRQGERATASQDRPQRLEQLDDFHLAAWILIENDAQVRISEYAQENAKSPQVQQFASRMAKTHSDLVNQFHGPMLRLVKDQQESQPGQEPIKLDYSTILKMVGEQLERARDPNRQVFGFRGEQSGTDQRQPSQDTRKPADEGQRQPADRPQGQQPRGDRPQGDRPQVDRPQGQQSRTPSTSGQQDTAGQQKMFDQDTREMLRRSLPAFVDLIQRSVEGLDIQTTGLAFIDLKRQLTEKHAESIIQEMKMHENPDQAYLGFEVLANLKLIDTMEVAKQHGSEDLQRILENSIPKIERQIEDARQLMKLTTFNK